MTPLDEALSFIEHLGWDDLQALYERLEELLGQTYGPVGQTDAEDDRCA